MSIESKLKTRGIVMLVVFFIVLFIIFLPIFHGHNGMDYLDNMFNSISKGSAYYIPQTIEEVKKYDGTVVNVELTMADEQQAAESVKLFEAAGATVTVAGNILQVEGDIGAILHSTLVDADSMYKNDGEAVKARYGANEREAFYAWYQSLKAMGKNLNKQKLFKEAKIVSTVMKKAVETSYNYYGIEARSAKESAMLIIFSLAFYVFYTLWYGFGIMYLFEGLGLKIGH
ncbi:MAG: hypothetical protein M8357_11190 [Desulfobulbaceae bacterium]|nr:hypothetical protein [Desulfobulbaceae bacterium]